VGYDAKNLHVRFQVGDESPFVNTPSDPRRLFKSGDAVEVVILWNELGVEPTPGLTLLGDMGVIYGNEGGTKNAIRYLWSDKSPGVSINNDIPSEIRIHPNQWGGWVLE
jgi:hypothetical protein